MNKYNIILILLFSFFCNKLPDSVSNSIQDILLENEKIQSELLQEKIPNLENLKLKLNSAIESSKEIPELNAKLKKLTTILNISNVPKEEFYLVLSNFSENLSDILISNKINTDHHKFYCPMVSKYWIAKGVEVKNPYAPEMRDCGELVK